MLKSKIQILSASLVVIMGFSVVKNLQLLNTYLPVDDQARDDALLAPHTWNVDTVHNNENNTIIPIAVPIKQRPWMVLHVGPPKSGTSTIQDGLRDYSAHLASHDNVFYLGLVRIDKCIQYRDRRSNSNKTFPIVRQRDFFPHPSQKYLQSLKYHLQQKHNVVISSEAYTAALYFLDQTWWQRLFDGIFLQEGSLAEEVEARLDSCVPSPQRHYSAGTRKTGKFSKRVKVVENPPEGQNKRRRRLKKLESKAGILPPKANGSSRFRFDVKIVVTYRHYFQWLPSYYFQSNLVNNDYNAPTLIDYIKSSLKSLSSAYIFDDENFEIPPGLNNSHGTLYSYVKWSSQPSLRDRVEIFDMHQQQIVTNHITYRLGEEDGKKPDLLRDFVCQVLPNASETCLKLHQAEEQLIKRTRNKKGLVSSLESGQLSDTQALQLILELKTKMPAIREERDGITEDMRKAMVEQRNETSRTFAYDLEHSIFLLVPKRKAPSEQLRANFYDWVLKRKNSTTDDGHRQICLDEESTRALKAVSWKMLRHLEKLVQEQTPSESRVFKAPSAFRTKHPLLLSPRKYDHFSAQRLKLDDGWWASIKSKHDELFDKAVESGDYCELDMERLFADEEFVKEVFFRPREMQELEKYQELYG